MKSTEVSIAGIDVSEHVKSVDAALLDDGTKRIVIEIVIEPKQ